MRRQLLSQFAQLVVVLFGVSFLVFMLLNLLPGDPAEIIASASNNNSPEGIEAIRKNLGLDQPLFTQYWNWLLDALQGDLGESYRSNIPVLDSLKDRLPVTLELVFLTELVSLVIAVPLAIVSAYKRESFMDRMVTSVTFAMQSVPSFISALVLIYVLAVRFDWLPALGYVSFSESPIDNMRSMAIPVMAMSMNFVPIYYRMLRYEMIGTLQEDHILLARAQGIAPRTILFRYAFRPSLPNLTTVVGLNIGTLVGGTLIVELISGLPGIGTLLFNAISNRDYILVQGVVLVIASAYVVANFLVDLSYSILDPRVRR